MCFCSTLFVSSQTCCSTESKNIIFIKCIKKTCQVTLTVMVHEFKNEIRRMITVVVDMKWILWSVCHSLSVPPSFSLNLSIIYLPFSIQIYMYRCKCINIQIHTYMYIFSTTFLSQRSLEEIICVLCN